jgi:hypothetical protein
MGRWNDKKGKYRTMHELPRENSLICIIKEDKAIFFPPILSLHKIFYVSKAVILSLEARVAIHILLQQKSILIINETIFLFTVPALLHTIMVLVASYRFANPHFFQ